MKPPFPASTGLPGLDDVLGGLRLGDNVVWQVDEVEDYRHFAAPFVRKALTEGRRIVYMRFADHPSLVEASDNVKTYTLDAYTGFETFTTEVYNIVTAEGREVFYVFDCLSFLQTVWATDLMTGNFFVVMCPYLFELDTIAYFSILRHSHSFKTVARIRETTQLLLEIYRPGETWCVHPLKVWNRYSSTMFLPHLEEGKEFVPIINSVDATQLFADASRRETQGPRRYLDYWDRLFMRAEDTAARSVAPDERQDMIDELCRIMIGKESRMFGLARKTFTLEDLLTIKSRVIGTGFVGGKTVGMLLARKILELDTYIPWQNYLEHHDSFYIGSDIFYTYIVQNGLWKLRMEQKTREGYFDAAVPLREKMLAGNFPYEIKEQFQQVIEYFGQSPIIIRSSSLLEDAFGNAFAGKYDSIFSVNQGSPEQRYMNFVESVRQVFASTMNEDALTYRLQRGLDQHDEQMALLVQRVSGSYRKHFFFPDLAGVGISYNNFVWKEGMDPRAGMLRLVAGLGTRAVNRVEHDYPRTVALDNPLYRPHAALDEARRFSQHNLDVLNVESNEFETLPLMDATRDDLGIKFDLFGTRDTNAIQRMRERGYADGEAWILTFDSLLSHTSLTGVMHRMLKRLEEVYDYPVETEFTVNFTQYHEYKINLLQCRPVQTRGKEYQRVTIPATIDPARVFISIHGHFMGGSIVQDIARVILVDPLAYSRLGVSDKYSIARAIGKLNRLIKDRNAEPTMLLGPGRWGTSIPSLGVPVRFAEINNITFLGEIAYMGGNLMPELSFGTHFFQDLVETDIFYLALFPDNPGVVFERSILDGFENVFPGLMQDTKFGDVIKVYDTKDRPLRIMADIISQRLVSFV